MRGTVSLAVLAVFFLTADLIQRTVVVAVIRARPRSRDAVLTWWIRAMEASVLGVVRTAGGAKARILARIPGRAGTLILMNHQSVLDIPVAIRCIEGQYPMIVTRERYRTGYPLISHMVRLYDYPTVRPGEHAAFQLESLKRAAASAGRPMVIYPEGTRTRDGAIRPFKTAGLKAILDVGAWTVYLLVVDGMSKTAGLKDFVKNVSSTTIRAESVGPFRFDGSNGDKDEFIASMRVRMVEKLAEMRSCTPAG